MTAAPTATWHNWARTESAAPTRVTSPVDTAAVVREVLAARERGGTVKMVGTGHSFTADRGRPTTRAAARTPSPASSPSTATR